MILRVIYCYLLIFSVGIWFDYCFVLSGVFYVCWVGVIFIGVIMIIEEFFKVLGVEVNDDNKD